MRKFRRQKLKTIEDLIWRVLFHNTAEFARFGYTFNKICLRVLRIYKICITYYHHDMAKTLKMLAYKTKNFENLRYVFCTNTWTICLSKKLKKNKKYLFLKFFLSIKNFCMKSRLCKFLVKKASKIFNLMRMGFHKMLVSYDVLLLSLSRIRNQVRKRDPADSLRGRELTFRWRKSCRNLSTK